MNKSVLILLLLLLFFKGIAQIGKPIEVDTLTNSVSSQLPFDQPFYLRIPYNYDVVIVGFIITELKSKYTLSSNTIKETEDAIKVSRIKYKRFLQLNKSLNKDSIKKKIKTYQKIGLYSLNGSESVGDNLVIESKKDKIYNRDILIPFLDPASNYAFRIERRPSPSELQDYYKKALKAYNDVNAGKSSKAEKEFKQWQTKREKDGEINELFKGFDFYSGFIYNKLKVHFDKIDSADGSIQVIAKKVNWKLDNLDCLHEGCFCTPINQKSLEKKCCIRTAKCRTLTLLVNEADATGFHTHNEKMHDSLTSVLGTKFRVNILELITSGEVPFPFNPTEIDLKKEQMISAKIANLDSTLRTLTHVLIDLETN